MLANQFYQINIETQTMNKTQKLISKESIRSIQLLINAKSAPRETECLILWVNGFCIKKSSALMGITPLTVQRTRYKVKRKMGVNSQRELIEYLKKVGALREIFECI